MRKLFLLAVFGLNMGLHELSFLNLGVDGWTLVVDILILVVIIVTWLIDRKKK